LKIRKVVRLCTLAGLAATLAFGAPAISAPADRLPICADGPASTRAPTGPAVISSPGACRTRGRTSESAVDPARLRVSATATSGYHHLGAGTGGEWAGVSGRLEVVDGTVQAASFDFVAARFMVKRDLGGGHIAWLEAGWAETGWASPHRQHIYTYNTNTKTWQFYDQYALKPGDKVWLDLHTDATGVWQAWLWWNNRWNLLTAQRLPIGTSAYVEQYVELHKDLLRAGRVGVPPVTVDNVQLRPPGGGPAQPWRDDVPTLVADPATLRLGGLCLDWITRYDTWMAGDCPPLLPQFPELPIPGEVSGPPVPGD
jgi:hypothetical protein